jgi:hydroxymethylbilane synthase
VSERIVIGTRGSALARWQADHVAAELQARHPGLVVEQQIIVTEGDRRSAGLLADFGGKGLWVDEIERALTERRVDLAVHSLKDVPAGLAPGLGIAAIPRRADPRDALVSREGTPLDRLPPGARVGTSSLRRVLQVRLLRPDLPVEVLRGNVDTRLRKVAEGVVDAAVLACAGLDRLGHAARITQRFSTEEMLPAIGQGALALETRNDDARLRRLCASLSDPAAEATVAAERALLAALEAGCRTPVAGHAEVTAGRIELRAMVGRPDASEVLREHLDAPLDQAAALGAEVARRLLARGADKILAELG